MNNYTDLITRARQFNQSLDAVDHANGAPTPAEAPVDEAIRVVIEALVAGLKMSDIDCLAQASVMLDDLLRRLCNEPQLT